MASYDKCPVDPDLVEAALDEYRAAVKRLASAKVAVFKAKKEHEYATNGLHNATERVSRALALPKKDD